MAEKITLKVGFARALEDYRKIGDEEMVAFFEKRLEQANKKSTAERKLTPHQQENEQIKQGILDNMENGVAYLEKALTHIPEVPEPDEDSVENDETREWLRENIEKSLFKCTGRTSTHIIELEKNAQQHDLMACVELTIAYLEGNECQRDRDKAFDYASRLLFEDQEFVDRVKELWTLYKPRLDMIPEFMSINRSWVC